ncbi:MAG TPA: hypothetical protein VHF25_08425 [Nitriliruptorales bacterium]|nr:hypothetical protein [Nitriliruptorales bacterium]
MTVLVGGVGQLYQGDLDLGRRAAERLQAEDLGRDVLVEDFHYGAVAVAQRLEDLRPDALVLVGAEARGRPPGSVERRRIRDLDLEPARVQEAVADAGTGSVTIDLLLEVSSGLGVLPARTVAIEVEPARTGPTPELSPEALQGLQRALGLVRAEVQRAPVLRLADEARGVLAERGQRLEPSAALEALQALLAELERVDDQGRWGRTFAERDRLRLRIGSGGTGEGMDHLDWGLWWGLIEELDRLQATEAPPVEPSPPTPASGG